MTMLFLISFYFTATTHQSLGSYDLPELLKKYPSWSVLIQEKKKETNMTLLTLLCISVMIHQTLGSYDLPDLLKKYPTWTFDLEPVDCLIKSRLGSLKHGDPLLVEKMLRTKLNISLVNGGTHFVRKVGDPKWVQDPRKLPLFFDAREKWRNCAHLMSNVEDEGPCNTDSPTTVASVVSDRYCIFTNGHFKEPLSQEMLVGCAEWCTTSSDIHKSWAYAKSFGIPTGSSKGCLPYADLSCKHGDRYNRSVPSGPKQGLRKLQPCNKELTYDHECPKKCSNPEYPRPHEKDVVQCKIFYTTGTDQFVIRNEILAYGPVITSITLHDDFYEKPDGIYTGKMGRKFVAWDKYLKLIGWGEENGVKYWLAVNTWDQWRDKVFKIPRGVNFDEIEYIISTCYFDEN